MPVIPDVRDPGLQPERTELAWQRTAVAATGVSLVAAMAAVRSGIPLLVVPSSALGLVTFVAVLHPPRSARRRAGRGVWPWLMTTVSVVVAVAVVGLALAAFRLAQIVGAASG